MVGTSEFGSDVPPEHDALRHATGAGGGRDVRTPAPGPWTARRLRVSTAESDSATVRQGSTRCASFAPSVSPYPETGRMPSRTLNRMISIRPSQNGGKPIPSMRDDAHRVVGDAGPAIPRRDRGQRYRDQERQDDAGQHQRQRRLDAGADERQDIDLVQDRAAQLALREVLQEVEVLHPERLVEAVLGADVRDRGRRRAGAEHGARGIAGIRCTRTKVTTLMPKATAEKLQRPVKDEPVPIHVSPSP